MLLSIAILNYVTWNSMTLFFEKISKQKKQARSGKQIIIWACAATGVQVVMSVLRFFSFNTKKIIVRLATNRSSYFNCHPVSPKYLCFDVYVFFATCFK